jgi:hypothetical protein
MKWLKEKVRRGAISAISVLAMLCCAPVLAEDQPDEKSPDCSAPGQCLKEAAHKLVGKLFAYPKKFGLATMEQLGGSAPGGLQANQGDQAASLRIVDPMGIGPSHWDMENITFHDNSTLVGQLSQIEDFSLVTFWENRSAKLYLGISKNGMAGINIRQKRHKHRAYGSKNASARNRRPEIHQPYELQPVL